jgi:hypothetical protein
MTWLVTLLVVAAFGVIVRIYIGIKKQAGPRIEDWDTKIITRMRAQGYDPFKAYYVDFFFAMPSETACQTVRASLEAEGFRVDVKPVPEGVDQPFSLHATKALRLSVPDMRETSRRFGELARLNGGRYDGWMPGAVEQSG